MGGSWEPDFDGIHQKRMSAEVLKNEPAALLRKAHMPHCDRN